MISRAETQGLLPQRVVPMAETDAALQDCKGLLVSEGRGPMAPLHLPRLPRWSNRQLQRPPWALLHPICWAAQNTVNFEWDPEQESIRSGLEL